MSDFNINNITSREGQQGTVLAGITTVNSTGAMRVPSGPTDHRGGRGRGFFGGGYQATPAGNSKRVSYIEIATTGNSVSFGDLTAARQKCASFASATRGIWAGGKNPSNDTVIDYIVTSSQGGANDFGDLIVANKPDNTGVSDSIRGMTGGGENPAVNNTIEYVTMASTGGASEFGDLMMSAGSICAMSSPTRGIWAGGADPAVYNNIQYITIQTTGNAIDFGDLIAATKSAGGCSSPTRGLIMGGQAPADTNVISYITMATLGNATDFGDLTVSCRALYTFSSKTRGISGGGEDTPASPYLRNHIDYVTIAATGNATDFGDIVTSAQGWGAGCSDSHGGLGD